MSQLIDRQAVAAAGMLRCNVNPLQYIAATQHRTPFKVGQRG